MFAWYQTLRDKLSLHWISEQLQQDLLTSHEISAFQTSLYPESKACMVFFQMVTLPLNSASIYPDVAGDNVLILDDF